MKYLIIFLFPLTAFAQANSLANYTLTGGTSYDIPADASVLRVNPASLISTLTLTMSVNAPDRQELNIFFGGTIANGSPVITTLTLAPGAGQSILQATAPIVITSGDYLIYKYDAQTKRWYKKSGVLAATLSSYLKTSDTTVFARATPIFNNAPARTFNTGYVISASRSSRVSYTVQTSVILSAVVGAGSSQVFLEISPNNSTWTTINACGQSETLGVGVSVTRTMLYNVQGDVPAGYYCRLRSVLTGGGSITYSSGQETTY